MATKADFNAEEWSTVVEGPVLAGLWVVRAGGGGMIRETMAIGKVYAEARKAQGQSGLLDELVASPPALDQERLKDEGDIATAGSDRLRTAVGVLNEKATDDVDAYKRFVMGVAQAAAEAHKEGGFIGIGGEKISGEEQAALDEIKAVLDSEAPRE